jgi:hypothetical protein
VSAADRFQILLGAISLVFLVFSTGLGVLLRMATRWTRTEDRLADIADDVRQFMAQQAERDRQTNERITWLERNRWGDPPGRARTRM